MNNQLKLQRLLCVAVCFFCIGIMTAFAQEQKVTVELKNATLKQVFKSIEGQTTYRFSYRNTLVDDKSDITISKRQVGVSVVLNEVLKGRNLTYTIVSSKSIVISDLKEQATLSKNKRVSGTVKSANGEPIIGANVKVTGTTIGCITDLDGKVLYRSENAVEDKVDIFQILSKTMSTNNSLEEGEAKSFIYPLTLQNEKYYFSDVKSAVVNYK